MNINDEEKSKIKIGVVITAFAIVFFLVLSNFNTVVGSAKNVMGIFSSVIAGICIAFVLNVLVVFFENKLFIKLKFMKHPKAKKFIRPASLILTLIVFFGIVSALFAFVIPQFAQSAATLAANIPSYIVSLESFANNILSSLGIDTSINQTIVDMLSEVSDYILTFISTAAPKVLATTLSITSGILNAFIGFIFAIYMLASKERILRNCKKIVYAFLPLKAADYTKDVYRLVKGRFAGFVTGQLTEAFIVGVLCFIGMSIFKMEYALLISVIIGVTNMIPVVGPIIGAVPGALIMLMVDPMKALWFVVFVIVLQQLESNLIYPKVVGDSIGLPGIWVLFSIIVGGNLFGFMGVLLGVPVFAVIYTLLGMHTNKRLKLRGINFDAKKNKSKVDSKTT